MQVRVVYTLERLKLQQVPDKQAYRQIVLHDSPIWLSMHGLKWHGLDRAVVQCSVDQHTVWCGHSSVHSAGREDTYATGVVRTAAGAGLLVLPPLLGTSSS